MTPSHTAYIVATVNTQTGVILGACIFSEPEPTMAGRKNQRQLVVGEYEAGTYEEAVSEAESWLRSGDAAWLGVLVEASGMREPGSNRVYRTRNLLWP